MRRIAAISTVIRKDKASDAPTIVGKYLFGFNLAPRRRRDGHLPAPRGRGDFCVAVDVEDRSDSLATMMWRGVLVATPAHLHRPRWWSVIPLLGPLTNTQVAVAVIPHL